ncbi:MAG TPA: GYD domain-containing protein [Dehalococcoidia bacterium]|nr:GYD domain-containing protein [Dehalococcoidia bacterium]
MPKYLVSANYSAGAGVKGLLADGGTKRVEAVKRLVESVGGKLEAFYFAFGDTDAFVIIDVPDSVTGAAISLTVNASGLASCNAIQLLTAAEIDRAAKMSPAYDAPGPSA